MRSLWEKIFNSLEGNGQLAGSFFTSGCPNQNVWQSWGAWLLKDEVEVKSAVESDGVYDVKTVRRRPKAEKFYVMNFFYKRSFSECCPADKYG